MSARFDRGALRGGTEGRLTSAEKACEELVRRFEPGCQMAEVEAPESARSEGAMRGAGKKAAVMRAGEGEAPKKGSGKRATAPEAESEAPKKGTDGKKKAAEPDVQGSLF